MPSARCSKRDAAASLANHDVDGRFVQFVAAAQLARLVRRRPPTGLSCTSSLTNCGSLVPTMVDHAIDLVVAQVGSLAAQQRARAGPEEQHVAVAQQLVGPHFVEHHAAVRAARDLERDAGRQVRLDQAGDDVDRRLLRGEHQVNTDRPALLRQPNDVLLDFLGGGHHQVRHFVGHDHDVRQVERNLFALLRRSRAAAVPSAPLRPTGCKR